MKLRMDKINHLQNKKTAIEVVVVPRGKNTKIAIARGIDHVREDHMKNRESKERVKGRVIGHMTGDLVKGDHMMKGRIAGDHITGGLVIGVHVTGVHVTGGVVEAGRLVVRRVTNQKMR